MDHFQSQMNIRAVPLRGFVPGCLLPKTPRVPALSSHQLRDVGHFHNPTDGSAHSKPISGVGNVHLDGTPGHPVTHPAPRGRSGCTCSVPEPCFVQPAPKTSTPGVPRPFQNCHIPPLWDSPGGSPKSTFLQELPPAEIPGYARPVR